MNKFFGWLLIIIGVLVAGTAGLCCADFVKSMFHEGANADAIVVVALVGGVPFLFGLACIVAGWVMRKGS
jgi:hypothetical protein